VRRADLLKIRNQTIRLPPLGRDRRRAHEFRRCDPEEFRDVLCRRDREVREQPRRIRVRRLQQLAIASEEWRLLIEPLERPIVLRSPIFGGRSLDGVDRPRLRLRTFRANGNRDPLRPRRRLHAIEG